MGLKIKIGNRKKISRLVSRTIDKVWGVEEIIFSSDDLCVKKLHYSPRGKSSNHFHIDKLEVFLILKGTFDLRVIDPETGSQKKIDLTAGESIVIPPGSCHEIYSRDGGTILESSTKDTLEDSYRLNRSEADIDNPF